MAETIADLVAHVGVDVDKQQLEFAKRAFDEIAKVQMQGIIDQANNAARAVKQVMSATTEDSKKASGGVGELWSKLRNFWLVEKGIEGFQGLKHMAEHAIHTGAAMGDLADKTGLTLDKVQELSYAGEVFGLSSSTMANTVNKLAISLDSAAKGGGDTAEAFKKAGIKIKDASGKVRPAGEVLLDIADRIKKVYTEDASKAPAEAMKLLGKSGKEMIPLLKEGSEKFAELGNEAHEFGLVLDKDTVEAMDRAEKNTKRLSKAWEGIKEHAVAALIPEIEKLTASLLAWYKANKKDINEVVHQAFHLVLVVVKALSQAVMFLVKAFATLLKYRAAVLIFLASAGLGFVVLRKEMVKTAIASAKAGYEIMMTWIKALAPIAAFAAALTLIILLVDDIYAYASGKEGSLMGDLFGPVEDNALMKGIKSVFSFIFATVESIIDAVMFVIQEAKNAYYAITGKSEGEVDRENMAEVLMKQNPGMSTKDAREKALQMQVKGGKDYDQLYQQTYVPQIDIPSSESTDGMPPVNVTQSNVYNINGGDPAQVRQIVEEVNAKDRRMAESTMGVGKKR